MRDAHTETTPRFRTGHHAETRGFAGTHVRILVVGVVSLFLPAAVAIGERGTEARHVAESGHRGGARGVSRRWRVGNTRGRAAARVKCGDGLGRSRPSFKSVSRDRRRRSVGRASGRRLESRRRCKTSGDVTATCTRRAFRWLRRARARPARGRLPGAEARPRRAPRCLPRMRWPGSSSARAWWVWCSRRRVWTASSRRRKSGGSRTTGASGGEPRRGRKAGTFSSCRTKTRSESARDDARRAAPRLERDARRDTAPSTKRADRDDARFLSRARTWCNHSL